MPVHVIQRGNNRAACFLGDVDHSFYVKCLAEAASHRACAVHAYALMTNHVHLLLTPRDPGAVSAMMQDLGRRYVRVFNDIHARTGTLWQGRFRSALIDSESYLLACHRYIELNPVRAGIVVKAADYPWSSHAHYCGRTNGFIIEHPSYTGLGSSPVERRRAFLSMFDRPIDADELVRLRTSVNKGWALGSDAFLDRMAALTGRPVRPPRRGRPRKPVESAAQGVQAKMLL